MTGPAGRKVLVSGASIAGPTLAYWLDRYGFDVTLVERSNALRGGGYAIDIRGTAMDVIERMGMLEEVKAAHIQTRCWSFLKADGRLAGSVRQEDLTGGIVGRDVELHRGTLAALLYARTRDRVDYRFNDRIAALESRDDAVDVTFASGKRESFDLVLAADGIHSSTRELVFGPEEPFSRYLGYCFAGFTMENRHGFFREGIVHNTPGKAAAIYETANGGEGRMNALLVVKRPQPSRAELNDIDAQRAAMQRDFAGSGWIVPEIVEAMQTADDIYFDAMEQIFMPRWSVGRVAVVGDAAYGPSFFSGQGTSLALVGAYVLAGELAIHASHADAFRAYDDTARSFVEGNQATARDGGNTMAPDTPAKLWMRNRMIGLAPLLTKLGLVGRNSRQLNSALVLKDYDALIGKGVPGLTRAA